jgi:nitroreductase
MSLVDTILSRRSIRRYAPKPIPKELLEKILEAGRMAPSAMNRQSWHFVVVTDDAVKQQLSGGLFARFIKSAPVVIVGCAHRDRIAGGLSVISAAIALENMVIAAWAMGIGSCWIGGFRESKVKRVLAIPDDWDVIAIIPFGYPAETPKPKAKKPLEEITSYNKFSR